MFAATVIDAVAGITLEKGGRESGYARRGSTQRMSVASLPRIYAEHGHRDGPKQATALAKM